MTGRVLLLRKLGEHACEGVHAGMGLCEQVAAFHFKDVGLCMRLYQQLSWVLRCRRRCP